MGMENTLSIISFKTDFPICNAYCIWFTVAMSQRFQCQLVLCNATVAAQAHAIPWNWTRQEDTDMSIDTLEAIYIGQVGIFWKNNFPSTFCFFGTQNLNGSVPKLSVFLFFLVEIYIWTRIFLAMKVIPIRLCPAQSLHNIADQTTDS